MTLQQREARAFVDVSRGGGTKRRQQKDIDQAKALHAEYKDRKKALATAKKGIR